MGSSGQRAQGSERRGAASTVEQRACGKQGATTAKRREQSRGPLWQARSSDRREQGAEQSCTERVATAESAVLSPCVATSVSRHGHRLKGHRRCALDEQEGGDVDEETREARGEEHERVRAHQRKRVVPQRRRDLGHQRRRHHPHQAHGRSEVERLEGAHLVVREQLLPARGGAQTHALLSLQTSGLRLKQVV